MEIISVIGMVLGVAVLIYLTFKGVNGFVASLVGSVIVIVSSGLPFWGTLTGTYAASLGSTFGSYLFLFTIGSAYSELMKKSGAAESIANFLFAFLGVTATVAGTLIITFLLAYGGVNAFIIIFAVYPVAVPMFRKANVSKLLMPAIFLYGAVVLNVVTPGAPSMLCIALSEKLGVTTFAAPTMAIVILVLAFGFGVLYFTWAANSLRARGIGFVASESDAELIAGSTGGKELQARISQLTAQYQQLVASAKYQVQGETLSGGQLRFALTSTDRERRKAAYDAQQQTAVENGPVMEKLLRELVHARNQLARENGFASFADYGDLSMQRLGYGRAELDEFCRQVQKYITPLYLQMQEQQRQRLGVETLLPYDRALVFPEGNAVPVATEELPKVAGRMYHALSPEAGHFFDEMVRHDLLDVAGSPNKISGMGFCDMLGAPCGMPFIFANCDGTGSDVTVYTHELGHGLQGYLSYRSQPLADYVGLSPDLAEVHSKTMELLTLPYARDFFGPHAPQFLTEHRYDFIKELCAFCSIHTFETWLYEHPDASLSQWAEEFDRTEKVFGRAQNNEPWRQQVLAGCDLFTNTAIYMFPRYVVSYALSIVCAQQLKAAYDADPVDGWARYHALCASGGSKLYAETLAAAGLELPYAPGVVERLARELAAQA